MAASIEVSEEKGVRYLHFGSHWIQGAMRLARPWALELEYTRDMMVALLLRSTAPWPKSVLVIGLGAGSVAKFLYRHRPRAILTVVEIEPAVVNAASQFFKLPDDARRLAIEIGDGNDFVAATRRHFDLIMVDGYDAKCRAGMLETLPFYCNCRSRLSDDGLLVANFLSRRRGFDASLRRISEAFDGRVFVMPQCKSGNLIALAAAGTPIDLPFTEIRSRALKLRRDTGLDLLRTVARFIDAEGRGPGGRFEF